jgi:hypothetical protein
MFTNWDPRFLADYGTSQPLVTPAPSYTNETGVAQARPLLYEQPAVDYSGSYAPTMSWTPKRTTVPTPMDPAAPSPPVTAATNAPNATKQRNPVVWVGLAAGLLVILWALRR